MPFNMREVLDLLPEPYCNYPSGYVSFELPCVCGGERLNINLAVQGFKCKKCDRGGGMLDLYSLVTGCDRKEAYGKIMDQLGKPKEKRGYPVNTSKPSDHEPMVFPKQSPIADLTVRNHTYQTLFDLLVLASGHQSNLLRRGFTKEEIAWLGYKSAPLSGYRAIVEKLQTEGCYLKGVPGFHVDKNARWIMKYLPRGIMIPLRDENDRLQGTQIRKDDTSRGKFSTMSSKNKEQGAPAKGWAHFAGKWEDGKNTSLILTEGPLKADMASLILKEPCVAIPGVDSIDEAMKMLGRLKKRGLQTVRIALDMDYLDVKEVVNEDGELVVVESEVKRAYRKLIYRITTELNLKYTRICWPREYKGIDDYLAAKYRGVKAK